jgi:hypothetical protein
MSQQKIIYYGGTLGMISSDFNTGPIIYYDGCSFSPFFAGLFKIMTRYSILCQSGWIIFPGDTWANDIATQYVENFLKLSD